MKNLSKESRSSPEKQLDAALAERELRRLEAERAGRSLAAFISFLKPDYIHSEFSLRVCAELDRLLDALVAEERPIDILQAPPQHGKSTLASRYFPAYALGKYPHLKIGACSYSADLAEEMSRDVQAIMLDERYRAVFPDSWLGNPDPGAQRSLKKFTVPNHKGYYVCTGVGGPLTGKSLDLGIIDDPIKNEQEARSATIKRSIQGWYNTVFLTRLSKKSGQIIMATRWALDDLSGVVAKNNPRAKTLSFPALGEDNRPLVPELHPLEKLLEVKAALSPNQWSALYQQRPVPEGGAIFLQAWIQRWNVGNLPESFDEMVLSWDMTFKDTDGSDYVVGQVWARKGVNYYLLHQVRSRMSYTVSRAAIKTMAAQYPQAFGILIEDKANGPAVLDDLQDQVAGLIPVQPDGSKVSRAYAVTPLWAGKNVFIPENEYATWVSDFEEEIVTFPAAPHDDQVDAMTQALRYLKAHGLSIWEALA
jgi:predicted phage terminase large subunit-like protein